MLLVDGIRAKFLCVCRYIESKCISNVTMKINELLTYEIDNRAYLRNQETAVHSGPQGC